ncbi:hypothetical protein LCGC14_1150110 [marine sediment metagenome]|uniref:Uncharacterized protein n=1 Tax=marine sediment metagenome TaxID=412755 RepID=A0A0F9M0P2_9ZZZZ
MVATQLTGFNDAFPGSPVVALTPLAAGFILVTERSVTMAVPCYGGLNEGQVCIHNLGRPCKKCGHVAVPTRFYKHDRKYPSPGAAKKDHEQALEAYVEWAEEHIPEWYETHLKDMSQVLVTEVVDVTDNVTGEVMSQVVSQKVCGACGEGFEGYGKSCSKCRKAKSRAK